MYPGRCLFYQDRENYKKEKQEYAAILLSGRGCRMIAHVGRAKGQDTKAKNVEKGGGWWRQCSLTRQNFIHGLGFVMVSSGLGFPESPK